MDSEINAPGDQIEEPLAPDEVFSGGLSIAEALKKLRLRLLDLTGRNRLLNFKPSAGKSLQFVDGRITACYQKLVESSERRIPLHPVPQPRRTEFVDKLGKMVRPDVREYAKGLGISTSHDLVETPKGERELNGLRALEYPEDLERQCRKLATAAKTAIEETGANMLFLVLGFLEFPEGPGASKTFLAPLVPIPVSLEKGDIDRASGTYRYSLAYTGEELAENLSLREKLKQDFNVALPVFTEESTLESYYRELTKAIDGKEGFKLRRQATLALISMTKMLLVRDLDPRNWPGQGSRSALLTHPIVKLVFEGATHGGGVGGDNDEYVVDSHNHADIPLIFDADSSQHSALIDVLDGKNLVIEGPPGTGKSQTITNLVASAIANGKKVLFVAEKVAALQVVKNRLTQAGLADFCLELHSNKTSKKDVLDSIEKRANKRYPRPQQLPSMVEALAEKRRALTTYVDLVNTHAGNAQGMTIHQVLWRAERHRQKTGESWQKAQKLKVERAAVLTKAEFDSLFDELCRLAKEHERIGSFDPTAPLWGFYPSSLPPAGEIDVGQAINEAVPAAVALRDRYNELAEFLDMAKVSLTKEEARALAVSVGGLAASYTPGMAEELLPHLFENQRDQGKEAEAILRKLGAQIARASELTVLIQGKVHPNLVVDEELRKEAPQTLAALRGGLAGHSPQQLEDIGAKCRTIASETRDALAEIQALAEMAGHQFRGTDQCVSRTGLPIELSVACPRQDLHLRCPELASQGSAKAIQDAKRRFTAISVRHHALGERLYMDVTVAEREVEEAVQTLREGDEWWRFFQSRQRHAIAFHSRIAKEKKASRETRRQDLEALHAHLRETRLAKEDLRYRKAMGSHWSAETTEFDALYAVAQWIETSNSRILEAGLDEATFSPLEVSAAQVATLSRSADRLARATAILSSCSKYVAEGPLRGATDTNTSFRQAKTWQDRAELLDSVGKRLILLGQTIANWGPPTQPCESIVAGLGFLDELQKIQLEVDRDEKAKGLIGDRHRGLATALEPIFAALAYGRAVIDLWLPVELSTILLSASGEATRKALLERLATIEMAWIPLDAFCDFMSARGRFVIEEWAGVKASSPSFLDGFLSRLEKAKAGIDGLLIWSQYVHASDFAKERGLGEYVDLLEKNIVPRDHIPDLYGYRIYGTISESLFEKHRTLGRFSALSHEAIRREFVKLDREIIKLRGKDVASTAAELANPPAGNSGARVAEKTGQVLLQYLFPQARPRMPIRKMMKQAGAAIQEYKPCFMMGPQAVAQYLEPGEIHFDIIVMDEASQLKPEEALGAIARGSQLVVVGDPKQLPPTTFFDKLGETDDDDDGKTQAAVMQPSILEVCIGHFRPVRTLRWHYRSQHHSLIAFSNARFYRNNLIVFPSPYDRSRNLGCKMQYVPDASYDSQMNIKEANVVVDAVLAHMRDRPDDSLGVVTLNLKQRELIDELLQRKFRDLKYVDKFLEVHDQGGYDFFIKNLENVQGDERDVIFISTTFGPTPGTKAVAQRFGPISQRDGWRRLNVLFTRARKSLTVFTSMRPEDIVDGESVPRGRRELRAYLEYLRSGTVPQTGESAGEADSDFEVAVMEALERHSYQCTPQLGVAGYRIDLAVKHPLYPGTHLAAIECDGASYHSGRSARDRDRIRQEILERLGWDGRIYRVWSTDWYRAPGKEIGRIVAWLDALKAKPMDEAYLVRDPEVAPPPTTPITAARTAAATLDELGVTMESVEAVEVQIGDKVTYANLAQENEASVTIGTTTDEARRVVDYRAPLAEALLGLQIGEIGQLLIPDRKAVRLRVLTIERPAR